MNKVVEWFVGTMKESYNIEIPIEEVGYESVELFHDEVGTEMIESSHIEKLPNPFISEMVVGIDNDNNEWIACIIVEEETNEWLYHVWLKNGERICSSWM